MFFFRIDLGSKHGLGHYNRVASLIKYLKIKKYKIVIENLTDGNFLKKERKNIICLYTKKNRFKNEYLDAKLFSNIIKSKNNSVVIKDSYKLGYTWEKNVKKYSKKLIIIDDYFKNKHFADFYINHSPKFFYPNKNYIKILKENNKKNCSFLLGPNYSLFNASYNLKETISSDFVFYNGGSGNLLIYEDIIKALSKSKIKNFKIILIVGPYSKNYRIIFKKFKNSKNIIILNKPENILNYIKKTKLFISSAGISMFEASYLKLPSLLIKMNDNQNLLDEDYEKLGHFFSLDKNDLKNTDKMINLILLMFENRDQIKKMMSSENIKLKNIQLNFIKNLRNKI